VFGPGDRRPLHLLGSRQVIWLQVGGDGAYVDLTPAGDWYTGADPLATDWVVGYGAAAAASSSLRVASTRTRNSPRPAVVDACARS
jgi:hypothetical protein